MNNPHAKGTASQWQFSPPRFPQLVVSTVSNGYTCSYGAVRIGSVFIRTHANRLPTSNGWLPTGRLSIHRAVGRLTTVKIDCENRKQNSGEDWDRRSLTTLRLLRTYRRMKLKRYCFGRGESSLKICCGIRLAVSYVNCTRRTIVTDSGKNPPNWKINRRIDHQGRK